MGQETIDVEMLGKEDIQIGDTVYRAKKSLHAHRFSEDGER